MKRLVILCDGTWLDPGPLPRASNVRQLARLVLPVADDGVQQVVCYHPGTDGCATADATALGAGIDREIQALYRAVLLNWAPGDELYFFGFSRGAYAVRSCIGMLRNAWLLEKRHEDLLPQAYHVYRTTWGPDADNAQRFRRGRAREVRVRFLGAWDTVGERGVPFALFPGLDPERYGFHDDRLSRIVERACHALAIDERRNALPASPWRTRADRTRTEQAWFSGSHADVGGGHRESALSWITLDWMCAQAGQAGLQVDRAALAALRPVGDEAPVHAHVPPAMRALGTGWRRIGRRNADETLHASAEQRFLRDPAYRPGTLREYLARDEQIRLPL